MGRVVIAYDIPHDRRRTRLHDLLLAYGEPVQRSVFECDLDDRQHRELRLRITRLIRPGDRIRLYPLCAVCAGRVDDGHGDQPPGPPEVYMA